MHRVAIAIVFFAVVAHAQAPGLSVAALHTAYGPISSIQDIVLTGYSSDAAGVAVPLKLFVRDKSHFRYEIGAGASVEITIFNAGRAWLIDRQGTRQLTEYGALQRPDLLPFFDVLADVTDSRAHVTGTAQHLRVQLPDVTPEKRLRGYPLDETAEFDIDPDSLLIVRSTRSVTAESNLNFHVPSTKEFFDHRRVQGILVPFRVVTRTGVEGRGVQVNVVTWDSVTINQNLPDSLFRPR